MADPKDNLKSWKPGQSGNPGGMTKIDGALRTNRTLSKKALKTIGDALLMGDTNALEVIRTDGIALEKWLAGVVLEGIKKSDMGTLNTLLPWLIGKPPEEIQITAIRKVVRKRDGTEVVYTTEAEDE